MKARSCRSSVSVRVAFLLLGTWCPTTSSAQLSQTLWVSGRACVCSRPCNLGLQDERRDSLVETRDSAYNNNNNNNNSGQCTRPVVGHSALRVEICASGVRMVMCYDTACKITRVVQAQLSADEVSFLMFSNTSSAVVSTWYEILV